MPKPGGVPSHILLHKDTLGCYRDPLGSFYFSLGSGAVTHYLCKPANRRGCKHFLALNCIHVIKFLLLPKLHYYKRYMALRLGMYRGITICEFDYFGLFLLTYRNSTFINGFCSDKTNTLKRKKSHSSYYGSNYFENK